LSGCLSESACPAERTRIDQTNSIKKIQAKDIREKADIAPSLPVLGRRCVRECPIQYHKSENYLELFRMQNTSAPDEKTEKSNISFVHLKK
jgi:hypothetical protein